MIDHVTTDTLQMFKVDGQRARLQCDVTYVSAVKHVISQEQTG